MSKKDKKRIGELERQQSILLATMRVLRKDFNTLSLSIVQDKIDAKRAANSFQASTIPSEKEQEKTEQPDPILNKETRQNLVRAGRSWGKLVSFEVDEEYIKTALSRLEKEQQKTEQPQQSEAAKEQELMAQLNKELAKFATLEAFNTERANRGLPAIDKLEFDKAKSVFDYALAAAKVLRPQWYDKINQIKIPQTEQDKPEQSQPENHRENLGEPVLNKPKQFKTNRINPEEREENIAKEDWDSRKQISAEQLDANLSKLADLPLKSEQELAEAKRANRINAALKDAVDDLTKHLNFTLENFGKDRARQVEMLQAYCDHFKEDLSDFRRKVLSVSELVGAKQDEPKQEQKQAWIIQSFRNTRDGRSALYVQRIGAGGLFWHTHDRLEAIEYLDYSDAERAINNLICDGRVYQYSANDFKILHQSEPPKSYRDEPKQDTPPPPEQKEADKSGSELGETWLIYDKVDKAWAAKCSEGGFYWSSKQDDFVLKFTSESEAKQRYDALCSRGLISVMHRANSGVIRKE